MYFVHSIPGYKNKVQAEDYCHDTYNGTLPYLPDPMSVEVAGYCEASKKLSAKGRIRPPVLSAPATDGIYYVWMDLEQTTPSFCTGNNCPVTTGEQYWGQGRGPLTDVSFLEVKHFNIRQRCTFFEFLWGRPLVSDFRSKPCHDTLNHAICQVPCEPGKFHFTLESKRW